MRDNWLNVRSWVTKLVELALAFFAVAFLVQILYGEEADFFPGDLVNRVIEVVEILGSKGLVGILAAGIILWLIWIRKQFIEDLVERRRAEKEKAEQDKKVETNNNGQHIEHEPPETDF